MKRAHHDQRMNRLTLPQACVLSTLATMDGVITYEKGRWRIVVPDRDGFRCASACHEYTLDSLIGRRLIRWDRTRCGYVASALGKLAFRKASERAVA